MNETTQANVERFNQIAAAWDDSPLRITLARMVAGAILRTVPIRGHERALEFGAGTGLVTALLAPSIARVLALDSSSGMLAVLREKCVALRLDNVETLEADATRDLPEGPFDLIFSSMTLHHIEDIPDLLARLRTRLAPGGWVALADLEAEDGTFHGEMPGIRHHGFEPAHFHEWLEAAGFDSVSVRTVHHIRKEGADGKERQYPVFLALGRAPTAP